MPYHVIYSLRGRYEPQCTKLFDVDVPGLGSSRSIFGTTLLHSVRISIHRYGSRKPVNSLGGRSGSLRPADRSKTDRARRALLFSLPQLIERQIDHGSGVKREYLGHDKASHNRYTKRLAQFAPDTHPDRKWQRTEHRGQRGHHDGTASNQNSLINRLFGCESLVPLGVEREVDHHDRVLFDDTNKQNDPNDRHNR